MQWVFFPVFVPVEAATVEEDATVEEEEPVEEDEPVADDVSVVDEVADDLEHLLLGRGGKLLGQRIVQHLHRYQSKISGPKNS